MRVFYVFSLKKEQYLLYRDCPKTLYQLFRQIHYMQEVDINYAFSMIKQLTCPFDKKFIDKDIFIKKHNCYQYSKNNEEHILNDLYKFEISTLKVKRYYALINTNKNNTELFDLLLEYNDCIFSCDFLNEDYFFVKDMKVLATNK